MSEEAKPYVKSLFIDSARTMGVARPVWERGKFRLVYPDHFPCLLTLEGLPWKEKGVIKEEKKVRWNLAKTGGWNRYEVLTNECSEALNEVIDDKTMNIDEVTEKVNKIHDKVKYRSFGKVTLSARRTNKHQEKEEIGTEEEKAKVLLDKQVKEVDKEIRDIEEKQKGTVGRIYEIKKKVNGVKKEAMMPAAVISLKQGDWLFLKRK